MKIEGAAAEETSRDAGPVRMMTVREVSAYLRVHRSTICRLLKQRQIPAFQVGSDGASASRLSSAKARAIVMHPWTNTRNGTTRVDGMTNAADSDLTPLPRTFRLRSLCGVSGTRSQNFWSERGSAEEPPPVDP
jgi:excisionase family DNA binding protein